MCFEKIFYDFFLVFTFVQVLMARIHVREILVVPCLLLKMEGEVEAANCIAKTNESFPFPGSPSWVL